MPLSKNKIDVSTPHFCIFRAMTHNWILIALIACTNTLLAQTKNEYRARLEGFEYVDVAKGPEIESLPLLIAFHYSSGNPLETIGDYDSIKTPLRIIIPKGNFKKRNGFSYYPTDYYKKDTLTQIGLSRITVDSISKFVQAIEMKYNQKAIVSGISQGGDIAFLLAIYHAELCRASFPLAAVIHSNIIKEVKRGSVKIPIYLFQGEADEIVSVHFTRKKVKEIGDRLQLQLFTYRGVGHDISAEMKMDYSRLIEKVE